MKKITTLIMIFSLPLFLIGCNQPTESIESKIIGTWTTNDDCEPDIGEVIKFESGGKVSVINGELYKKWEFTDDKTKLILSNPNYGSHVYNFEMFEDGTLLLVKENSGLTSCRLIKK